MENAFCSVSAALQLAPKLGWHHVHATRSAVQYRTRVQISKNYLPQTCFSGLDDGMSTVGNLKLAKDAGNVITHRLVSDH